MSSNAKALKLQYLLIQQLLKEGSVQLLLPDGIVVEIGITKEDKYGDLKKQQDYCYLVATRDGKRVMLDSYNLGLQFEDEDDTIICEDTFLDEDGTKVKSLDIV